MDSSLRRKLILGLALGFLAYAAIAFMADLVEVVRVGRSFPWLLFPAVCLLASGNYLLRLVRWNYYLRHLGIELGGRESAVVFFAGLAMSITPGKFGELLKTQYVKNINGTNRRRTAPVVLAERITDLIGVLLLASFGIFHFRYGEVIFFICLGLIGASLVIISSRKLSLSLLALASRFPLIGKVAHKLEEAYENIAALVRPQPLALSTILSVVAWGCEGFGFYLIINAFPGTDVSLMSAFFIYAFATVVGAVSMLPGGLVATEGTMTGLLILLKVQAAVAVAATLITRLATLWFAVVLGLVVTAIWRRLLEGSKHVELTSGVN